MNFGASVVVANYFGMVLVFLLSYKRAFAVERANWGMVLRFATVAHIGLVVTWVFSLLTRQLLFFTTPELFEVTTAAALLAEFKLDTLSPYLTGSLVTRLTDGFCHGWGIVAGFVFNYLGHSLFSFRAFSK